MEREYLILFQTVKSQPEKTPKTNSCATLKYTQRFRHSCCTLLIDLDHYSEQTHIQTIILEDRNDYTP